MAANLVHPPMLVSLRRRAEVMTRVRRFFDAHGYLEVETPILVPSPGLDLHLDAYAVDGGGYLITSPEYQMKRLLAEHGAERIYQLVRCFRRGEQGHRHNREFTMLEWYRVGASVEDMMAETEALVCDLLPIDAIRRMTVAEAFAPHDVFALSEDDYFRLLVDEVEPKLTGAVFLHDYPAREASLARLRDDDPRVCERFELYVDGVELCNGFGELTDPVEQRARLEADQRLRREAGKPIYPIDEKFIAALEKGLPRCAGNALGIDRLLMLALGAEHIGEVMAYPTDRL